MSGEGLAPNGSDPANGGGTPNARPDWLPEGYWDDKAGAAKSDVLTKDLGELGSLRDFKKSADDYEAGLPKDAKDYKVELPQDFKLPDGVKFSIPENDPLVPALQNMAKERGLDQEDVRAMTGLFVQHVLLNDYQSAQKFAAEQKTALGQNADARMGAAGTWIKANFSETQQKAFAPLLQTKDGVEAIEALQQKLSGVKSVGQPNGATAPEKNPLDVLYPSMAKKG